MAATLDRTYDGIIIGAGQHGLVLGSYLAKAGLKILLVDRRLTYGGGLCTREVTKPGFYHNLHSINHFSISDAPWFADLNLADKVTYITPRYEFGQAHLDGTALVLGRDLEETVANIARFSKKDAQTFRDWNARAEEMTAKILIPERYAEPLPQAEREALLSRTSIGREFLEMTQRQPLDVVEELFENEHVKLLVPVQGVAVRHLAHRHPVQDQPDGLGDPRLRSADRLPALSGRFVQSGARADGDFHRRRRHVPAAGVDRPGRGRGRTRHRYRTQRWPHRARVAIRREHCRRAYDPGRPARAGAVARAFPQQTRQFQIHRLDAVRAAPRPA